ncbi:hypothetical protein D9M72_422580 [compost metagenome]
MSPSPEFVADCKVPEVFSPQAKSAFTVNVTAAKQSSFAGAGGKVPTQRSNVVVAPVAAARLNTLT